MTDKLTILVDQVLKTLSIMLPSFWVAPKESDMLNHFTKKPLTLGMCPAKLYSNATIYHRGIIATAIA